MIVMIFRVLCACVMMIAGFSQPAAAQQNSREVRSFLPPGAVVQQQLTLDTENDGKADAVLLYTTPDPADNVYHNTGIQVLKNNPASGWAVSFEETETKMMAGNDSINLEKLRSPTGKEALLVISHHSGAGTVTAWHVLASMNQKITSLDPTREKLKVLNTRAYVDNGYNGVKSKGDLIIEEQTGYSRHTARCCPDRPSLEMTFKFTGNSLMLDSVRELPYGVPKSGPHGPLLRLSGNGLWAYGYQLADGFLVLGGSKASKDRGSSTPPAVAALRKSLLNQGVLADAGSCLSLMADYKFTSTSDAASVMLARRANGEIEWKDENGKAAGPARPASKTQ